MNTYKTYTISGEDKKEIISVIKSNLLRHEEIIFAYIYGFFVKPEMPFFRDIDVGIYLDEDKISAKHFIDYAINISLEFESAVKMYPVDMVVLNSAPLSLAFKITQGELLFIRDDDIWTDFVTMTWSRYHDHAITSRHILEEIITA